MASHAPPESKPASGENNATVPEPVRNVLSVWNWAMPILVGLLSSELLRPAVREWWRRASPNAKRRAGIVCAGAVSAVAICVLVPYNEVLCTDKTPFFGRELLCNESARSAVAHLSLDASAYAAQALSVAVVAVFSLSRRTATQLVVVGGAVSLCAREFARHVWWGGLHLTWWVVLYAAAPCAPPDPS